MSSSFLADAKGQRRLARLHWADRNKGMQKSSNGRRAQCATPVSWEQEVHSWHKTKNEQQENVSWSELNNMKVQFTLLVVQGFVELLRRQKGGLLICVVSLNTVSQNMHTLALRSPTHWLAAPHKACLQGTANQNKMGFKLRGKEANLAPFRIR